MMLLELLCFQNLVFYDPTSPSEESMQPSVSDAPTYNHYNSLRFHNVAIRIPSR